MSKPKFTEKPTDSLVPYVNNARTHSPEQVAQIAASIKEFGFLNPILVDKQNTVIAGHGRLLAAQKLGLATVPCVQVEHLTEAQRKAYILADNKLAANAEWDEFKLISEMAELMDDDFNIELLGFNEEELDALDSSTEKLKTKPINTEELNTTYILLCVANDLNDRRVNEAIDLLKQTSVKLVYGSANKKS